MTDQAPELLPCPFCGSIPRYVDGTMNDVGHFVRCDDCHLDYPQSLILLSPKDAANAWNTRPTPSERPVRAEPVRDACCETGILPSERPVAQVREALEPFLDAIAGVPEGAYHDAAPFVRVPNDARAKGTVRTITWGQMRKLLAALTSERPSESAVACDTAAFQDTDDADATAVLAAVRHCANSWDGSARLLGNVRAVDIARACSTALVSLAIPHGDAVRESERAAKIAEGWYERFSADMSRANVREIGNQIAAEIRTLASERVSERETMTSVPADSPQSQPSKE